MFDSSFRPGYRECLELLWRRLSERAPTRIQLLTGPRQVGKTTLLLEIAERLGDAGLYFAADGPEASLPGARERIWVRAAEKASTDRPSVLLIDEVHLLHDWAADFKGEWDRIVRKKSPVHVVATGSSALRMGRGSRESLAGRFERLTLTHWSAASIRDTFGGRGPEAADTVVRWGSYPGAWRLNGDRVRWAAYVRDAMVEPATGRDILALASVRRPALLRQVFGICVSSPAQVVSFQKLQRQLHDRGALETVAHYLGLIEEAYLVAAVPKYAESPRRMRSSPPRIIVLNNALMAASDPRGVPEPSTDPARFGVWVENACLAFAWNAGQQGVVLAGGAVRGGRHHRGFMGPLGDRGQHRAVRCGVATGAPGIHPTPSEVHAVDRLRGRGPGHRGPHRRAGHRMERVPPLRPAIGREIARSEPGRPAAGSLLPFLRAL